mmetsp:Transcript_56639/g.89984  ORF Transcript_56639/g.89984 Transcript_56639/m.89984 type:complete len:110 (-) Transcript_56639:97-426(-)
MRGMPCQTKIGRMKKPSEKHHAALQVRRDSKAKAPQQAVILKMIVPLWDRIVSKMREEALSFAKSRGRIRWRHQRNFSFVSYFSVSFDSSKNLGSVLKQVQNRHGSYVV